MFSPFLLGLSTLCGLVLQALSQASQAPVLDAEFSQWLSGLNDTWAMRGVAIAVVRQSSSGDWTVETKGYGTKDYAGSPVTPDVSNHFFPTSDEDCKRTITS